MTFTFPKIQELTHTEASKLLCIKDIAHGVNISQFKTATEIYIFALQIAEKQGLLKENVNINFKEDNYIYFDVGISVGYNKHYIFNYSWQKDNKQTHYKIIIYNANIELYEGCIAIIEDMTITEHKHVYAFCQSWINNRLKFLKEDV